MAKYILLKKNSAKVPLLGTKSKPYTAQIDNNIVTNWYLMDEAWLVTNVYMGNKGAIAQSLRATNPDIGPNEIDMFIDMVKKDHPLEHINFNWNNIPLYADAKSYCDLSLPWLYKTPIRLTQDQEKELLGIVQDDKDNKKLRMTNWFYRYRRDYGIDARLKRDREIQDEELASLFCLVHGFDSTVLRSINKTQNDGVRISWTENQKINNMVGLMATICLILIFITALMFAEVRDRFVIYLILGFIELSCAAIMVYLYAKSPKDKRHSILKEVFFRMGTGLITISIIIAIFVGAFSLLLIGNESDSWMVGILCAIPFFLVVGGIANFLKRK